MHGEEYFTGQQYAAADYVSGKIPDFKALYRELEAFPRPGNKLLEVGSATGQFLQIGRERSWTVAGIELSKWAARQCAKNFGINVIVGRFEEMELPAGSFDVVVMTHVLEHLQSPRSALVKAWNILREGGLLLAEVPNQFDDLWNRIARPWAEYRAQSRGPFMVHTFFFSPPQFVALVKDCGFGVLRVQTMRTTSPSMSSRIPGGRVVRRTCELLGGLVGMGPFCTVLARKEGVRDPAR